MATSTDRISGTAESLQRQCTLVFHPKSDKLCVHFRKNQYRITSFLHMTEEYKFPSWSATSSEIENWFWQWVDIEELFQDCLSARSESDSTELYLRNKHMLDQSPNPTAEEEQKKPKKAWACSKCGCNERPEGKKYAIMCTACRMASHAIAQKSRDITQQKTRLLRQKREEAQKKWKCASCGSDKRPMGRYATYCTPCKEQQTYILNQSKIS